VFDMPSITPGVDPTPVEGGVCAARGFTASGVSAGLKANGKLDVALVAAERSVPVAAVFTTNKVAAAPVVVSRRHVSSGRARAVVINAGNANACTGASGEANAVSTAQAVAAVLTCDPHDVVVSSTGVIGVPLPLDLVLSAVPRAAATLRASGSSDAASAIMTTDTFAKEAAVSLELDGRTVSVGGMAKGSGMIAPDMATMLSVITTDAPLTSDACAVALGDATRRTFNRISVDSDTSTNDMVVLMASGDAGGDPINATDPAFGAIAAAVLGVAEQLARMIVRDGEGATKLITITVCGASDDSQAEKTAMTVANSPLVKTAIFGGDANWGRVAAAAGRSGCDLDPDALDIRFAGIEVCQGGTAIPFDEDAASAALKAAEVDIVVDLNLGEGCATVWTCDLTYEYVRINGDYRS
jgi:glutamate N-acetyltransferase/amino-acid N-acetyltransferase